MRALIVSTVMTLVAAAGARAADLGGDRYGYGPADGSGYAEDDGYDSYDGYDGDDRPPPARYGEAPRDSFEGQDWPGSVKDGYPVPMPAPEADARHDGYYDEPPRHRAAPRHAGPRYACLGPWQIRRKLRADGWSAIRPMGGDGHIVHIRARRHDSSSLFRLRVERCTGDVLAARPYLRSFAGPPRFPRY